MTDHLNSLADAILEWLASALGPKIGKYIPPPKPGAFSLLITSQSGPTEMIVTASLPAPTASDVKTFTLHYSIDGAEQTPIDSTGDPITFNAAVGTTVVATFTESDASGNTSVPSEPVTLLVTDTIAPGQPGVFTVAVTGQEA